MIKVVEWRQLLVLYKVCLGPFNHLLSVCQGLSNEIIMKIRVLSVALEVVITLCCVQSIWGHARLMEPPSRSSMWRHGYDTPKNYDDDGLYCGGMHTQWKINGGKCGVCGDPWHLEVPRPNENGGKYGNGIIVRTYKPGQVKF
ncbi:chitin-binding type-4 domain-containing protein [Trichonephila clavata]|uniref:Chitin-binding type-4 domain-containing protein n=1 Tax=Trichonephila clavata TaxID=2740835 RepID=A0A8X6EX19_TRICU|nr:chitin-binding type-4 domain-containing protein [Trichonephila clavata]